MEITLNNLGTVNKNAVYLSKPSKKGEGYTAQLELVFSYKTCVHVKLTGASEYITATHNK